MAFAINSVVRGYETVTPYSHTIIVGIYFCGKAVTRNIFSKRKVSSKYPKIKTLQKLPTIRYIPDKCIFVRTAQCLLYMQVQPSPLLKYNVVNVLYPLDHMCLLMKNVFCVPYSTNCQEKPLMDLTN